MKERNVLPNGRTPEEQYKMEQEMKSIVAESPIAFGSADHVERAAPPKKRHWLSAKPEKCDLCKKPLSSTFVDGATCYGPWAIMCPSCHVTHGHGLGIGRGQKYDLTTLEKIGG